MTQNLITVPQGFAGAQVPAAFQGVSAENDLSAGITGGFGIVTYKGKVWRTKYRGVETALMDATGRNPRPELEVVIIKAAQHISKVFYQSGFVDGSNSPPDCWSVNGVVPDPAASAKQSNTCAGCPQNAWGSRISEAGKAGKACSDNKRLAIVPAEDILNESLGGPLMLRVPPASLQDMSTFGTMMEQKGFPYYALVTRLRFDPDEAYPKFIFEPVRPLTEEEAKLVIQQRNNPITQRILEAAVVEVLHDTEVAVETKPTASELFNAQAAAQAAQMASQVTGQPQPVVKPQPVAQPTTQVSAVTKAATAADAPLAPTQERPKFHPMTGEPIVYEDEKPRFDPMTGKPLAGVGAQPVAEATIPDLPKNLVRAQTKAQPVVAKPTKVEKPKDEGLQSFDDALDNLLGAGKN